MARVVDVLGYLFGLAVTGEGSLKQTKIVLQAVLTTTTKNFNCCVQILVELTNKILNELTREVQDLKDSLHFSQGQHNEFKQKNSRMTTICKSLKEDISSVCELNNTIVDRIAESPHETWTEFEELRLRLSYQRNIKNCNILFFTES